MGLPFYDYNHKVQKLDRTICIYNGEPYLVLCGGAAGNNNVELRVLGDVNNKARAQIVDYMDERFDYRAFPLGYTNWKDATYYTTRSPDRQNSQGLSRNSIHIKAPAFYETDTWFMSSAIRDTIKGDYPPLAKALKCHKSMAFSRYFAVRNDPYGLITLEYRGRKVGLYNGTRFDIWPTRGHSLVMIAANNAGVPC